MTRINVGFALNYVKLLLIYVQFEVMVYQQIVGIPMDTNCAPHIYRICFYLILEGFYL